MVGCPLGPGSVGQGWGPMPGTRKPPKGSTLASCMDLNQSDTQPRPLWLGLGSMEWVSPENGALVRIGWESPSFLTANCTRRKL